MTEQQWRAARLNSWGEDGEPRAILFYSQSKPKPPPMTLAAALFTTPKQQNEQNFVEELVLGNSHY
jgi:hypothetical protein